MWSCYPDVAAMFELLVILVPIVTADALNPVLAAAVIFALGTRKPYRGATWVLLGWAVVYFVAGIVLVIGLEWLMEFLANPRPVDFAIQTPIAVALIWLAYTTARDSETKKKGSAHVAATKTGTTHTLGVVPGFLLGATINLVGLPFAIPYFAAIDQILKADLDTGDQFAVLALYNLAYVLPFAALALLRWIYREDAGKLFERINAWMEKAGAILMPIMFFLIGAALLLDTVLYFVTGNPLINVG